jgi:hypothetical protein
MLGGPEDGRTFEGPGDVPPPTLVIALPGPLTAADLADATGPVVESAAFRQVPCYRARYSDGRWLFVWPAGPTS